MTGKQIKSFTKSYSEPILYLLVLLSVSLHKFLGIPNLSIFFLLFPLVFLEIRLLDKWVLLWLFYPIAFLFFDALWLLGMTLSAFAEELFFRAYLMKRYSNLSVSFMFVIPHFILYPGILSLLTFFPSLFFGFAYQKTKSLAFVSLLHLVSNLVYFKLLSSLPTF
ncbi:CPBP family intramembrane glutamic endopeptidase [Thermocrinis sp.]|jgi:membrane protease YdiL (CAAX protease family)|uniref:CPBP family intramembrane glutamic endopeptidase n=1 Tax=Thermocrinis sp. TaxID=2024383 RepID=UPI003C0D5D6A